MGHRRRKCTGCKERYDKDIMVKLNPGWFCSVDCATETALKKKRLADGKAIAKKEREKGKADAAYKRKFYDSDAKTRRRAARLACHAYIRERDKGQPCICCGSPLHEGFHAGHYLEAGNNPRVRYDERNINGQNIDCNYFKGGDSGQYRRNLIAKISEDQVLEVESLKGGTLKRTAQDYKAIEVYYKDKLKALAY